MNTRALRAAVTAAVLLVPVTVAGGASAATVGPALTLDAAANRHTISPDIYGMNGWGVDPSLSSELRIPVQRWGGDGVTRYNWQLDSSNAGSDWYFMGGGNTTPTPSASADAFVAKDIASGGQTMMTVPMIPWINGTTQSDCSYPVSLVGPQQSVNPYVTNCGNGIAPDGTQMAAPNPSRINVANTPAFQAQWVQHFVARYGTAANGGVGIYEMDNEPSGWGNTHRDVHPGPTGWDELVALTQSYAAAVKGADPTAQVDGPGDFGWAAYVDAGKPGDNRASHGGQLWEAQYYLQQMAAYQAAHGTRLLDYFDEHYYPTTPGGVDGCIALCPAGDANNQAARLQATRSLWDPTYLENDWIGQWYGAVGLIPRMRSWVDQYYPGTKTDVSEYNFGGLESVNGALAEADALGIFGREGLDMADLWSPPSDQQPGAYAFRMYRNYDGQHSQFGDTAVSSTSADQGQLAIYGAQRSSDGALTAMVVNKTGNDLTSPVAVNDFAGNGTSQVWTYSAADPTAIVRGSDLAVGPTGTTATFPANSITLLVLPRALPAGWSQSDIGSVAHAGSARSVNGTFGVVGGGADIYGQADAFHFVDQPLAGDGTVTARVVSQTDTNAWAKAGVMIRSTASPGSAFVDQVATPSSGSDLQWRATPGGWARYAPPAALADPTWVRLVRHGTLITAFTSPDGQTWTRDGAATLPAGPALAGLAVTAHDNTTTSAATFDNVTVGP